MNCRLTSVGRQQIILSVKLFCLSFYSLSLTLDANRPAHSQILALLPDEEFHRQLESTGSAEFAVRWELPEGPRRVRINVFRHL